MRVGRRARDLSVSAATLGAWCRSLNDMVATARHLAAGQRPGLDRLPGHEG
jgi:hypothetical protein